MKQRHYLFLITGLLTLYACQSPQEIEPGIPALSPAETAKTASKQTKTSWEEALESYQQGNYARAKTLAAQLTPNDQVNNLLGATLHRLGQPQKAKAYYQKALQQRRTKYGEMHPGVSDLYNNLGNLSLAQASYPQALRWYRRALRIPQSKDRRATLYNNIGNTYLSQKKYDKARGYFIRALENYLPENQHLALTSLGILSRKKGAYSEAESYFLRAASSIGQHVENASHQLVHLYNHLSYLYYLEKKFGEMIKYVNIAGTIKHKHQKIKSYTQGLYEIINTDNDKTTEKHPQQLDAPEGGQGGETAKDRVP